MPNIKDPLSIVGGGSQKLVTDTGSQQIARGVQQVGNTLGAVATQQQNFEIKKATRLKAIQDKTMILDQQTKWGDFELDTLDTVTKREDFADLSPEDLNEEYDKLYDGYIDTQIKERGFAETEEGQAESNLYREALEAKKALALQQIEAAQEKAIGVKTQGVVEQQVNRHSNAISNDPTLLTEIFETSNDSYRLIGGVTGKAAADRSAAGARGLFIRTAAQAYINRKDWDAVDQLLSGVDPATGKELDTAGLLTVEQMENIRGAKEGAIKQDLEWAYQDLRRSVDLGQAGHAEIEAWRDKGMLTPGQWGSLISTADKRQQEAIEVAARAEVINLAMTGDLMLDPTNKDHKKGVDDMALNVMGSEGFKNADTFDQTAILSNIVQQTGILPSSVKSIIRMGMAGNTESQIQAADLVGRLEGMPFDALRGMSEADLAKARLINKMVKAGHTPKEAVSRATELTDYSNKARVEARRSAFKDSSFDRITTDNLEDEFTADWLTSEPDIPERVTAEIVAEANGIYQRQYELTGDADLSKEYAYNQMKKVWGISNVNGSDQLMKYPPQAFYGVGVDDDEWIRKQMVSDTQKLGMWDPSKPLDERLILVTDPKTAREASSGQPKYTVLFKEDDGSLTPVMDLSQGLENAVPLRWFPDRERQQQKMFDEQRKRREKLADSADEEQIMSEGQQELMQGRAKLMRY